MANTAEVISQTSSINLISKSISSTRSSLSNTNITIGRIQKILATKTKVRSDLFLKNEALEKRRREASKRREYEDQIEASKVSTNIQSGLKVASSSSQGPLGRILSFLGYMGAGWIIENLPTWIAMGKEFIARMKKAGELIYSIPQTMWRILQQFGQTLGFVARDIGNLDLTDSSGDIKNSFSELTNTIELLGEQISNGFKLMLQPSGEVDIPSTGEQQPDTGFPEVPAPTPGGGSGGGGKWKPLLDLIHSVESSTDKKNNGYDAQNGAPGGVRPGLSQMTIGEIAKTAPGASGRYQQMPQFLLGRAKAAGYNENTVFSPQVQDVLAIKLIEGRGGNSWLSGKISTEKFMQGLADEWAALPNAYGQFSHSGQSSSLKPEKVKSVLAQIKQGSSQSQTPTAPPRPVSAGKMNLIPQTGSGGFIQGGSGSGRDTTYATHFHIDAKTANPSAEQLANIREVSFQAVKVMFARGSTVYFGNIGQFASKNDSTLKSQIAAEQKAHGARSSAGVDIQENNPKTKQTFPSQPGSATKFPFAVGEVYYRGGYGREAEIIGTNGITVSHGAAGSKSSQVSPQLAKIPSETELTPSSIEQPQISSITPETQSRIAEAVKKERTGQQILFIDDKSPTQPSVSVGSQKSYSGGVSGQITEFDLLNKFMKQKLLLDFNYL